MVFCDIDKIILTDSIQTTFDLGNIHSSSRFFEIVQKFVGHFSELACTEFCMLTIGPVLCRKFDCRNVQICIATLQLIHFQTQYRPALIEQPS